MLFAATITVMPHKALLDPQGKAVELGLKNMGHAQIENVRIGKCIHLQVQAADEATARQQINEACSKLLANPIMESYTFEIAAQ
jgi:phosphoribosylformylglycinamidine synthase subunit PurS